MDGHTLLPLPQTVCTVVALPHSVRPLGQEVRALLHGPLLAGGETDPQVASEALADRGHTQVTPFAHIRALLAMAEGHARTGDLAAQVTALDAVCTLCERLRAEALMNDTPEALPPAGLTAREAEVLRHLAGGKTIRQAATELCLSPRTLERHITTIYRKIGAGGRVEATAYAIRQRLI
jgi:DNA-binding CsgD family transcriptional regulator